MIERTSDGKINNCALANGHPEAECPVCGGNCPDKVESISRDLASIESISICTSCVCGWESPQSVRITGVQLELQVTYKCPRCNRPQSAWTADR